MYYKIKLYYNNWLLDINASKCETILFRDIIDRCHKYTQKNWKDFSIYDNIEKTIKIPHKNTVKYLGVYLDELLRFNIHINNQLKKAVGTYKGLHRLFYSKKLAARAKVIAYLCLIRPIITYACPVWFNTSASAMEKIRLFERKCLRTSLNFFRNDDHKKFSKNTLVYQKAKTIRIDIFILKLIRNHIKNAIYNKSNPLIHEPFQQPDCLYRSRLENGFISPELFKFLDEKGYIFNKNGIPIIYHISRDSRNKKITYVPNRINTNDLIYDYSLNITDIKVVKNFKYKKK